MAAFAHHRKISWLLQGSCALTLSACIESYRAQTETSDTTATGTTTTQASDTSTGEPTDLDLLCPEGAHASLENAFPDPGLRGMVCNSLGLLENCDLPCAEVVQLELLQSGDYGVTDLTGISRLTNLILLDVSGNPVKSGIQELKQLKQLYYVDLSGNTFNDEDLKVLGGWLWNSDALVDLRSQQAYYNCQEPATFEVLDKLGKQVDLYSNCEDSLSNNCNNSNVDSIIQQFPELHSYLCETLDSEDEPDTTTGSTSSSGGESDTTTGSTSDSGGDQECVLQCEEVFELKIYSNNFFNNPTMRSGIPELYAAKKLYQVHLSVGDNSGISALGNYPYLYEAKVELDPSESLSLGYFSNLTNLRRLDLSGNLFGSFGDALNPLKNLRYLNLDGTSQSQIPNLVELISLDTLILNNNSIIMMNPEQELPAELRHLELDNNMLSTTNGLERGAKLEYLSIADNEVGTIDTLADLEDLQVLNLNNNFVADVSALAELRNLSKVILSNNFLDEQAILSIANMPWVSEGDYIDLHAPSSYSCENAAEVLAEAQSIFAQKGAEAVPLCPN